jgi:hypothetical protein
VRQNGAPLVRVPRIEHKHRVAEHGSRDGAHENLGLGVEICVGGVGQVAPCARGTTGSHTGARVIGCRLQDGGRLAPLRGRHRTNRRVAASPALGTLIDLRIFEIRESASSGTAQNWSRRVSTQETVHARHEISPALGTLRISAKRRLYYK